MSERLVLRKQEVLETLGISDETLRRIANDPENHDIWPKPIRLQQRGAPVWLRSDIVKFLEDRKKRGT